MFNDCDARIDLTFLLFGATPVETVLLDHGRVAETSLPALHVFDLGGVALLGGIE